MAKDTDLSLDGAIALLNPFIDEKAEGSTQREALSLAQAALLYIQARGVENDFTQFYKRFSDTNFTVNVSHEFVAREEADSWLASGNAREEERVKIAGKGFMVVRVSGRFVFMVAPLPEELETGEWKDDSE